MSLKIVGGVIIKLSEQIKQYRKDNSLTQQQLADILYVSKQAVSKWENDKSLPDLAFYPTIANLLNITVDELMGNEVKKSTSNKKVKKIIITSSIIFFVLVILLIIIKPSNIGEKNKIVNETEQCLDVKLPEISTYEIVNYNDWISFNNFMYPQEMYYFVFKDEILKIDNTWMEEIPQEIIDRIPVGSSEYPYICDFYKLIDVTTKKINEISLDKKPHEYILY